MSIPSSSGGSLTDPELRPRPLGAMLAFGGTLPFFGGMLPFFGGMLPFFGTPCDGAFERRSGGFEGCFAGGLIDARFGCLDERFSTATVARGT